MPTATTKAIRAASTAKSERLDARLTREQKDLIQRAADLQGRSLTDFVVSTLQESARQAIERHDSIRLNEREAKRFVAALLHPPKASKRLREAAKAYKALVEDPQLDARK
jgi:uncharacterized protein (DUF1778 family)